MVGLLPWAPHHDYLQYIHHANGVKTGDVTIGEEEGGLYKLKRHSETTFVHEFTDPSELWHRRLSHINYKALPHVNKVVMGLSDMKIKHEGISKGCAKWKNVKNPFPKSETKTKGTLELIHSDVCGPMYSTSLSGFEYYITFIDDFSRNTWIYSWKQRVKCLKNSRSSKPW